MSVYPFAWQVALRYCRKQAVHGKLDPEDLVQAAMLHVASKFGKFDPARNRKFISYFCILIERTIWGEVDRHGTVVAVKSGWRNSPENRAAGTKARSAKLLGDFRWEFGEDEDLAWIEDPVSRLIEDEEREVVFEMLGSLPRRQADMLRRYYLGGECYRVIGLRYGICKERVRQLLEKSLAKLREKLVG